MVLPGTCQDFYPSLPTGLTNILSFTPVIAIGVLAGEWLHHRIDEYRFKVFVFAVLLVAGCSINVV